jgi:hypothetical protein
MRETFIFCYYGKVVYCVDSHRYCGDTFSFVLFSAIKKYQKITAVKPRLKAMPPRKQIKLLTAFVKQLFVLWALRWHLFFNAYFSRRVKHYYN